MPLAGGRDFGTYLGAWVELFQSDPIDLGYVLGRTPVAPLVVGGLLDFAGGALAEPACVASLRRVDHGLVPRRPNVRRTSCAPRDRRPPPLPELRDPVPRDLFRHGLRGCVRRLVSAHDPCSARAVHFAIRPGRGGRGVTRARATRESGASRTRAPPARLANALAGSRRVLRGVRCGDARHSRSLDGTQRPALRRLHAGSRRQLQAAVRACLSHRADRQPRERACVASAGARRGARPPSGGAVPLVRHPPRRLLLRPEPAHEGRPGRARHASVGVGQRRAHSSRCRNRGCSGSSRCVHTRGADDRLGPAPSVRSIRSDVGYRREWCGGGGGGCEAPRERLAIRTRRGSDRRGQGTHASRSRQRASGFRRRTKVARRHPTEASTRSGRLRPSITSSSCTRATRSATRRSTGGSRSSRATCPTVPGTPLWPFASISHRAGSRRRFSGSCWASSSSSIRRPSNALAMSTPALAAFIVIVLSALAIAAIPHYSVPVAPAFFLLGAAAMLAPAARARTSGSARVS